MTEDVSFRPTKNLFIDVLTRDISVKDCILDLLDNSVDSYTRHDIRETREVLLTYSTDMFQIMDSCGGVNKDDLKNEIFRFGISEFSEKKTTIGIYGIGLKRSIFKLGNNIIFETDDGHDYCKLEINVQDWLKDEEEWKIPLADTHESSLNGEKPYTKITITNLREETKDLFRTTAFEDDIKTTVSIYYSLFINNKKIEFKVNSQLISGYEIKIIASDDYKPVKYEELFEGINIQIICWLHLSEKKVPPSGWNVYMNDRLVLLNDTSEDTGWKGDKPYLPQYHPIYNQFRGIVFLKTDEPFKLPMNTRKNGFNKDRVYYHLLNKMCEVSRPFTDFLGKKYTEPKTEMDQTEDKLNQNVSQDNEAQQETMKEYDLSETSYTETFRPPAVRVSQRKDTTIQYSKSKDRVNIVKKILDVKSNVEVGSETFEYFWDCEGLDAYK